MDMLPNKKRMSRNRNNNNNKLKYLSPNKMDQVINKVVHIRIRKKTRRPFQ